MHLLVAAANTIRDGGEAIDLQQTEGDILFLSAADTELASLSAARALFDNTYPRLRLANLLSLQHHLSVDFYIERMFSAPVASSLPAPSLPAPSLPAPSLPAPSLPAPSLPAPSLPAPSLPAPSLPAPSLPAPSLVVIRLLGGVRYWPYGVEQIVAACTRYGIKLVLLPGDDQPDPELTNLSSLLIEQVHILWQFLIQGGTENTRNFLAYAASLIGHNFSWQPPRPLLRAGLWWPEYLAAAKSATTLSQPLELAALRHAWQPKAPIVALLFYTALLQSGAYRPVSALIDALRARGLNPLPIFVSSLKDPVSTDILAYLFSQAPPDVILNATAFAISNPAPRFHEDQSDNPLPQAINPLTQADCPVIQTIFSGSPEAAWRDSMQGLSPRDLAMNIVLPEVDGRIIARAVSFKAEDRYCPLTEASIITYQPIPDRIAFTADLAAAWTELRHTAVAQRKIAVVLANYPSRDGRLANGVGLDTPAGCWHLLNHLQQAGYGIKDLPADGQTLIKVLAAGPTNQETAGRQIRETLSLARYEALFAALPKPVQETICARWGSPADDPNLISHRDKSGTFSCVFPLPVLRLGEILVGIQPSRGYQHDPVRDYHSPDLPPPHFYLAFYLWVRHEEHIQAIIHMGKHGNLEWLPGKAVALSENCHPEAVLGPIPHLYPFIVNDPGEGAQAKRRVSAVIIDHLTPPLTRAETYGPLRDLERLVDEYYEASGLDSRRVQLLRTDIFNLSHSIGLAEELGFTAQALDDENLIHLDAYLCDLKEMQIRDGLHIFGQAPQGQQEIDLLVALTRLPRGAGKGSDASLTRALANDLHLDFDPLDTDMAAPWTGARPAILSQALQKILTENPDPENPDSVLPPWRSAGDTLERVEALATHLIAGTISCPPAWQATIPILRYINQSLRPILQACGPAELTGILRGLAGQFVPPGPSGAPTRGRPDVLPTGRNFYSLDTRLVPTPVAWRLGWKSACLLIERYRQDQGCWPRCLALSAWGTANMRTGGDDIAQALALMGVRPCWEDGSGRVTGFEILPLSLLDRPRVDVTLRVSGFFRDAFPAQLDLIDSASRAVAALDESPDDNPLAAHTRAETIALTAAGLDAQTAQKRAGHRIFGSKPGAYGAGLQALIDSGHWQNRSDLASAYLAWGSYAYGGGAKGISVPTQFATRLKQVELVVHNQDNHEHDLLDSDDYYQFEGGLHAAVTTLSGKAPIGYHSDHSRPESPRIRALEEEIARVVRGRVVNPKWIAGVMRHGYKGAFELAATVDYLFAFAATTDAVRDHHFDMIYTAYIEDETVCRFIADHNPAALAELSARLLEAQQRLLWSPHSNSAADRLKILATPLKSNLDG